MIKEQENDRNENADRPLNDKMNIYDESKLKKQQQHHHHHLNVPLGFSVAGIVDTSRKHRSDTNLATIDANDKPCDTDSLNRRKALSINKEFHSYKYIDQQPNEQHTIKLNQTTINEPSSPGHHHQVKSAGSSKAIKGVLDQEQTTLKSNWIEKLKVKLLFCCISLSVYLEL